MKSKGIIYNQSQKLAYKYAYFISAFVFILTATVLFGIQKNNPDVLSFVAIIIVALVLAYPVFLLLTSKYRQRKKIMGTPFPIAWRSVLLQKVVFYQSLNEIDKALFEKDVQIFIAEKRIMGINTSIDDTDKLLVASSAIIPIFGFVEWEYNNLNEVLIYPASFDTEYETQGGDKRILGMVGNGVMNNLMILSQPALHAGFQNAKDKKNVGIHEFVHLIDMADGVVDGVPSLLLENQYAIPWLNRIEEEIELIKDGKSDINPYGATNKAEFFSVASESFFENPIAMNRKFPELYALLVKIFRKDLKTFLNETIRPAKIGRNSPCVCNSGRKFKHCCGK